MSASITLFWYIVCQSYGKEWKKKTPELFRTEEVQAFLKGDSFYPLGPTFFEQHAGGHFLCQVMQIYIYIDIYMYSDSEVRQTTFQDLERINS